MRRFNKLFVVALPRCATVSMCDALGLLGIRTAHLGRIYGEDTRSHHDPVRLKRMYDQIRVGDYQLDILEHCDGLADYPACILSVIEQLDQRFPESLFINVRRDSDLTRWLQSVERQFVGLQLLRRTTREPSDAGFMETMLAFRKLTFGCIDFECEAYRQAYLDYQTALNGFFGNRASDLLTFGDIADLETEGFDRLCTFLDAPHPQRPFPRSNLHSQRPSQVFMQALEAGLVQSQTGIQVAPC